MAILMLSSACDETSGDGFLTPRPGEAEFECRQLPRALCNMLGECGGYSDEAIRDCRDEIEYELSCDLVRATSSGYDTCINTIESECSETLPAVCTGVLLT